MKTSAFKNKVWDFKKVVSQYLDTDFSPIIQAHELNMLQYRILSELEYGNLNVSQISHFTGLAKTNASTLCKKMEQMGYLKRYRDKEDERIVILKIQPLGCQVVDSIDQELQEKYGQYIQAIPEQDIEEITVGLEKLEKILKELNELGKK